MKSKEGTFLQRTLFYLCVTPVVVDLRRNARGDDCPGLIQRNSIHAASFTQSVS
jgi:hypothetical protein